VRFFPPPGCNLAGKRRLDLRHNETRFKFSPSYPLLATSGTTKVTLGKQNVKQCTYLLEIDYNKKIHDDIYEATTTEQMLPVI